MGLEDWLTSAARARPHHAAVIAGEQRVTYAELDERAARLARRLAAQGVEAGGRRPASSKCPQAAEDGKANPERLRFSSRAVMMRSTSP
jgi:non-ribosomal peptide synthetase component F